MGAIMRMKMCGNEEAIASNKAILDIVPRTTL